MTTDKSTSKADQAMASSPGADPILNPIPAQDSLNTFGLPPNPDNGKTVVGQPQTLDHKASVSELPQKLAVDNGVVGNVTSKDGDEAKTVSGLKSLEQISLTQAGSIYTKHPEEVLKTRVEVHNEIVDAQADLRALELERETGVVQTSAVAPNSAAKKDSKKKA
jgi:hypothetical protein